MSEALDVLGVQKMVEKLNALIAKAHYEEGTGMYWIDASDWRELRELVASAVQQVREEEERVEEARLRVPHAFASSGRCSGCGMMESYYEAAMAILEGWPEDSEKKERMVELRTCRNDLKSSQRSK